MKRIVFIALCLVCAMVCFSRDNDAGVPLEQAKLYLDGNPYQQDLLYFLDLLEKTHPAFAGGAAAPFDMEACRTDAYKALDGCDSKEQLSGELNKVLARIRDGHTAVFPDLSKARLYPINLTYDDGRYFVNTTDRKYERLLGAEIVSVNGRNISGIENDFAGICIADNIYRLRMQFGRQYFCQPNLWRSLPYFRSDSTLTLVTADGRSVDMKPDFGSNFNLCGVQSPPHPVTGIVRGPFSYKILEDAEICYLQFNACNDYNTVMDDLARKMGTVAEEEKAKYANIPRFDQMLDRMFAEIRRKGIKTLVVDLRNNVGGNSSLCDQLLAYLMPVGSINPFGVKIRISEHMTDCYQQLYADIEAIMNNRQMEVTKGKLYGLREIYGDGILKKNDTPYFKLNRNDDDLFGGEVIFIQGNGTYSSAGMLLVMARDNNIGIIIGERSTFSPCHYGDMLPWQLPNTQIKGSVSYKYFTRPDADRCSETHLEPGVYIHQSFDDIRQGRDPYWEWVVNNRR